MSFASFTVDVDRDVNEPRAGHVEGRCRGADGLRFSSTMDGLERLVRLLGDLDIKATFFWEGRAAEVLSADHDLKELMRGHEVAAHGYDHEDLTGHATGFRPSEEWADAIVGRSLSSLEAVFGTRPEGFRCPYLHIDEGVSRVLMRRGLRYDSTLFGEIGEGLRPYRLAGNLLEVPLAQCRDPRGRFLQSYLWPLHEGRRSPEDYDRLLSAHSAGLLVLADHSWHIAESLGGELSRDRAEREIENVRKVLQKALCMGHRFMTVSEYLSSCHVGEGKP